jgi:hypothetical protein
MTLITLLHILRWSIGQQERRNEEKCTFRRKNPEIPEEKSNYPASSNEKEYRGKRSTHTVSARESFDAKAASSRKCVLTPKNVSSF